ncbi:hypothetical protein F1880_001704 [Penicillium rolfsii]|nr:hypothetical protein F1880_001704 [Penicillium rolfsii]
MIGPVYQSTVTLAVLTRIEAEYVDISLDEPAQLPQLGENYLDNHHATRLDIERIGSNSNWTTDSCLACWDLNVRIAHVDNGLVPGKHLARDYCENNEEAEVLGARTCQDSRGGFHRLAVDLEDIIDA